MWAKSPFVEEGEEGRRHGRPSRTTLLALLNEPSAGDSPQTLTAPSCRPGRLSATHPGLWPVPCGCIPAVAPPARSPRALAGVGRCPAARACISPTDSDGHVGSVHRMRVGRLSPGSTARRRRAVMARAVCRRPVRRLGCASKGSANNIEPGGATRGPTRQVPTKVVSGYVGSFSHAALDVRGSPKADSKTEEPQG